MKQQQLSIRLHGKPVGVLVQTPTGKMAFSYDRDAKQAISVAMPLREKPYGHMVCEAYFGGLLPENDIAKKILGQRYGVSPRNSFALLTAIGHDCAGAISCCPMEAPVELEHPLTARVIYPDTLYQHIKELPRKPLFMDVDGLRLSLAGVQDKAAVCLIDGQIALAQHGCPTTHILKPASVYFAGIVENEYFCLRLAQRVGLPVPAISFHRCKDITFLLIERYDRRIVNGVVERIHQEDFCQAMSIVSARKYQNESGPGFKECFALLMETAQPAIDRNLLAAALVFNYLIGNMDAHGKNFALLHHAPQQIRLAPFYDMLCTRVYEGLTTKMAMKIGTEYAMDQLRAKHWQQLCHEIGYRYGVMQECLQHYVTLMLSAIPEEKALLLAAGCPPSTLDPIIACIDSQLKRSLDLS